MRNIPTALNTHLQGELLTIADCLTIERNDGVILRMTNHDKNLVVNGQTYLAGASFVTSALKTSADLSVDNVQLDIGLDGELIAKVDLDSDLFKRAKFEILTTNWQAPEEGAMVLSRGWIGDITVRNVDFATLQLRGLTQALQRNFLQYYSPTCRAAFGDAKCGVPATPFTLHKRNHVYKVGDWALVPSGQNSVTLTNSSFETQGVVANGNSGISEWEHGPGSYWAVQNSFAGSEGSYYLKGGDDSGVAPAGTVFSLVREIGTSAMGMAGVDVDAGNYIVGLSAFLASPSSIKSDNGRVTITMLTNSGTVLKIVSSPYTRGTYAEWQEINAASFVVPGTRRIRIALEGVKTAGSVEVAFDNVALSFWNAEAASYPMAYKVVRIPGYTATDRRLPTNYRFVEDGEVSNDTSGISGWTYGGGAYFRVLSSAGGLSADDGALFLAGGDNGSTTPATVYSLTSSNLSLTDLNAATLADGGYIFEVHARAANITDLDSEYRAVLSFYTTANALISSVDSGYQTAGNIEVWRDLSLTSAVPATTAYATVTLYAKSGSGSLANVAFDSIKCFVMNTTLANLNDATTGSSANVRPAFSTTLGDFVYDGDLIWQAHDVSFGFDEVLNATDRRVFLGTTISGGEGSYYGAQIIWLTGANAGTTSYVRTWVPSTKELRLYGVTARPIAGGDRFMVAQGCGKSITDCVERFNNAVNFRGEPYLPGPQRVIELFTPNA